MDYPIRSAEVQQCFAEGDALLAGSRCLVCLGDPLTLAAVALSLKDWVYWAVTTEEEGLRIILEESVDFLITSEDLEQGFGMNLIHQAKRNSPDINCLLFLRRETQAVVRDALDVGADGVIFVSSLCRLGDGDFMRALRAVSNGSTYFPKSIRATAGYSECEQWRTQPLPAELTERERQVLFLLSAGATNKEIAERLIVSAETVKSHVSAIIGKLGVRDRTAAAVLAIKAGLDWPVTI